jgi:hypothetical protein
MLQLRLPSVSLAILPGSSDMPASLMSRTFIERLERFYSHAETESLRRFDTSVSKHVTRLPVGPDHDPAGLPWKFLPVDLRVFNVGSNYGLGSYLEEKRQKESKGPAARFELLLVDINIYTRFLRVLPFIHLNSL